MVCGAESNPHPHFKNSKHQNPQPMTFNPLLRREKFCPGKILSPSLKLGVKFYPVRV
jgi:hypothetical protein